jgi:murein DD-endopeptidase MepM/ murein hydrolase activator NlpD
MRIQTKWSWLDQASRGVVIVALSGFVAGCSMGAERFAQDPLSNPFGTRGQAPEATASIPQVRSAPVSRVESSALPPPPQMAQVAPVYQPPVYQPPVYQPPVYQPPAVSAPPVVRQPAMVTPSSPARVAPPVAASPARGNWTADGGTPIIIGAGDRLETISRRYGVPVQALAQTNGISDTSMLREGQRIIVPVFRYGAPPPVQTVPARMAAAPGAAVAAPVATGSIPTGAGVTHTVVAGDTLHSLARRYGVSHVDIARANNVSPDHKVILGQRMIIPGARVTQAAPQRVAAAEPASRPLAQPAAVQRPAAQPAVAAAAQQRPAAQPAVVTTAAVPAAAAPVVQPTRTVAIAPKPDAPARVAAVEPTATARLAAPANDPTPGEDAAKPANAATAGNFRWPVRGRIISGFGDKANGQNNDGINIAAPEGTPFKAAEDGVVAYAGNELKGFGNLVLVRHSNGYVTAYAHASEVSVKRGDTVRRGQVIGKTGQTGSVGSPQLHFEVRKGSTPVDPMSYLTGG